MQYEDSYAIFFLFVGISLATIMPTFYENIRKKNPFHQRNLSNVKRNREIKIYEIVIIERDAINQTNALHRIDVRFQQ